MVLLNRSLVKLVEAESPRESLSRMARVWLSSIFEYPKMLRSGGFVLISDTGCFGPVGRDFLKDVVSWMVDTMRDDLKEDEKD